MGTTCRVDMANICYYYYYYYYSPNGTTTTTTTSSTYYHTCITTYTNTYNEKHKAYISKNLNEDTSPDIEKYGIVLFQKCHRLA